MGSQRAARLQLQIKVAFRMIAGTNSLHGRMGSAVYRTFSLLYNRFGMVLPCLASLKKHTGEGSECLAERAKQSLIVIFAAI